MLSKDYEFVESVLRILREVKDVDRSISFSFDNDAPDLSKDIEDESSKSSSFDYSMRSSKLLL